MTHSKTFFTLALLFSLSSTNSTLAGKFASQDDVYSLSSKSSFKKKDVEACIKCCEDFLSKFEGDDQHIEQNIKAYGSLENFDKYGGAMGKLVDLLYDNLEKKKPRFLMAASKIREIHKRWDKLIQYLEKKIDFTPPNIAPAEGNNNGEGEYTNGLQLGMSETFGKLSLGDSNK